MGKGSAMYGLMFRGAAAAGLGALLCMPGMPVQAAPPPPGAGCLSDAARAVSSGSRSAEGQRGRIADLAAAAAKAAQAGDGAGCRKAADEAVRTAGLPPLAPILLSTSIANEDRGAASQVPAPPRPGAPAGSASGNSASTQAAPPPAQGAPAQTAAAQPTPPAPAPPQPTAGPAAVQQASAAPGDPAHGQSVAKVCTACHSLDKGGQVRVGPPLYGVEGRQVASIQGFGYSGALRAKGGVWDDAQLNAFLKSPRSYAPGTRMAYPGIANDRDRADVVAYLNTLK